MALIKGTTGSTEKQTVSERLNQSAYSYYSSTVIAPSGDRSTATGLKRFFAAALLSSSSIMVLSSPASALGPAACNPVMPANGTTVNCTGVTTSSQDFNGDDLTIIADENFNLDTSGNTIGVQRVNAGIFITGGGGTIQHSGTIKTGEIPEGMGTYGRHNGLYIIGGAGDVSAENTATGSITTTAVNSAGIQVSATTGTSTATNRGTIQTGASGSYGVAASNANIAVSRNYGTVTTTANQSHGVYAFSNTTSGSATSSNASGATINVGGDLTAGVISIGSTGAGTSNASNAGTINVTGDDGAAGVAALSEDGAATAGNTGLITLQSNVSDAMKYVGYSQDIGVFASTNGTATATNGIGASITDSGQGGSVGVYATARVVDPFDNTPMMVAISGGGTANATNDGTITLTGDRSYGLVASASGGTSTATNNGSITVTGDRSAGIATNGNTTNVNNTGTVTVTGDATYGVRASSVTLATTNVTNSGTITQANGDGMVLARYGASAVFASGPTVNITNTSTGTITGAERAVSVGYANAVTIINDGVMNGDVTSGGRRLKLMTVPTFAVTNSGTINGQVTPGSSFSSNITNNGGTIGDGTYATHTGANDDVVTITGSGNVINGAFRDDGGTGAGKNAINFNQTDTLTLNGTSRGYAFFGFETANFNSGTTVIAQERGIGTSRYMGGSRVNVNAGATLTTSSTNLGINTNQLIVSGMGTARGTLQAPAGSNIVVTGGDTTFEAGGRFRVGVASDTSAGYLNGGDGTVTFNAGSEIYADVTRGVELTDGRAIKIAGVDSGEGGMIVDNNVGGATVYDNTVLFSFTSEVRANSELFLITKRELRARTATENRGGRTNAEVIADAIDEFIDNAPTDNPIVRFLAQFPVDQQEAQLAKLVEDSLPSESGASGSSTVVSTDMVLDLIMDRLSGGGFTVVDSGERQTGVAAGEQFLGGAGNWALWGRAGASFAEFDPSGVNGFESDTYAVSLGMDGDVAEHLRMGLAVFYSDTKVDEIGAGANSNQDIEGYGVLLYGTYRPEGFYVNATLGYGMNEYDSRRSAAGGINTANYDGTQFMARAEVGKVFTEGAWDLSPHVGLRFNKVDIDGYTETGILPTTVASQSLTSLRGVLGVSGRYTHTLEDGAKLIPEAYVRGLQELADPNEAITGNVVGGGSFISQTTERDKFSYAAGAGLTYEMDEQFSVRFLYDGEFQTDYQEHSITAAIRYQF